jgi:DNA end-binding protein Ku
MARAIWTGAISFGLVNVPVKLYSATSPKTVRFHQLSSKTGARIRQKRVDPTTGDEVPFEDIVKGYELSPDRYVLIEPEELDALDPKATKTIDIEEFVEISDIDPIYYDHSYYLAPTTGGAKAYRLLLEAMREAGKVGIGRVVLRSKQQLCALRPAADVMTLTTMLFGDEVLPPDRIDELDAVNEAEASKRERLRPHQVPRRLSRSRDRPNRAQGRGRGDRGPAAGRGGGARARLDGSARGEPGRRPRWRPHWRGGEAGRQSQEARRRAPQAGRVEERRRRFR